MSETEQRVPESDSLTCQGQVAPKAQHLPFARGQKATKPEGQGDAHRSGGEAGAECAGKSPPPEPKGLARRALNGGGGNRTRVREPPRKSFYKRRPSLLSPAGR